MIVFFFVSRRMSNAITQFHRVSRFFRVLPPSIAIGDRGIDAGGVGSPIEQLRFSMVHGNVHGPGCRVGSSKVAQLAAIARRRCLPHDCHFKCAIMAAGLAKKNAILRNSSRGCLTGKALRRLGFTRSLFLSPSSFRSPREYSPTALRRRSHSLSLSLAHARALRLPLPRSHLALLRTPRMRIAVGPFTEAYGLRVATSPWSTTPSSPSFGSLSRLPPSSLPRSPSLFLFLQTFLPSSLPPLLPISSFAFVL